jgi:hypothetical protein
MRTQPGPTLLILLTAGLVTAPGQIKDNTEFRVKLTAPLSTETNRKGDKITALVLLPPEFANSIVEGEVKESKGGGKVTGKSILNFTFQNLVQGDKTIEVNSEVKAIYNSKGKENVDEEGRIIEKKSNVGKVAAVTGIGALIGGLAGGAKGAGIGAGAGAAAALVLIQVGAKGAQISFAPGSEILLSVRERRQAAPK